jgi:hypothetical protein
MGGGDHNQLVVDGRSPLNGVTWQQDFAEGHDYWSAYPYNAGMPHWGNVFYPATHFSDGYIVTDASRWAIDTPEDPDSVLAMLTYPSWIDPALTTMNLGGSVVSFDLMGLDLNLRGGHAFFWVVAGSPQGIDARWYKKVDPLVIGDGVWGARNLVTVDVWPDWTKSWDGGYGVTAPYFDKVKSWGIGFVGFPEGDMPSGALALRDFKIAVAP